MDGFLPDDYLDPRLDSEIPTSDLNILPIQRRQENNNGKIPGILLKSMFFGIALALLPLIQKQSPQLMNYTNQPSITRSWDLIPLFLVGLAVSYGLIARRPAAVAEKDESEDLSAQGTQDYVQNMFDFASVFDDYNSGADEVLTKSKAEAFSSRWRSEEPLHVIADNGKENVTEKPLLLPIRSLKHSLSNPQAFDFLYEEDNADVSSSKPAVAAATQGNPNPWKPEVRRNGEIFSVESGNFEAELSNIFDNDEPTVFRSPIPWSSRPEIINSKTPLPPAPAPVPVPALYPVADNLGSDDGKIENVVPSVLPSPIPWSSRLNPNTMPPAVENKPSDDGKQKISGENPQSSVLSDKQDCKPQAPPSRPPPPPPPPTVIERQSSEKNFPTRSVQKAAYPSPRSSPSPSVSPSPRTRPSSSPSPSPTPRQTPRPSPSPSPRQTPRPSPSPTRPRNSQSSSGIPPHKFSSPRPSPSPTRSRPVVMQNGSSEKQPNLIQRNNDEAGLTKKDDSAQRNTREMYIPSPPPPPLTPVAAEDPRFEKPEKKAPVLSSSNPPACPTVATNGSAYENRSSQRYDLNQSNGDGSRQKSSKDVLNSASSDEIKLRRGSIPPPPPPPAPPSEDLSAPKKPLENGFSHRSESMSRIRDASSDRSESTSRSRGATSHSSHSRHSSRDIEADSSVSKQKTRDADVAPLMMSEKSSRKVPSPPPPPPPVHSDVPLPDSFPQPPPRPSFLDEENALYSHNGSKQVVFREDRFTVHPDEVDQKADEFIAKFHEQIRLAKAQSYRERLDEGQKLGMKNDLS